MKQCTIRQKTSLSGIGLHAGQPVTITFHAAPADFGIKFKRIDLPNQPIVAADANRVVSTTRSTTLKDGDAMVATVEHVLSALMGLQIDNVLVEVDNVELPILDGSALPIVEALQAAGIETLDAPREYLEITENIHYKDANTGAELLIIPNDTFEITTLIDFKSEILGQQFAYLSDIAEYATEIAGARTFVFLHELEQLAAQGLIKGGDLENAVVIANKLVEETELLELSNLLGKKNIQINKQGILNTTNLRYKNEPARHKLLDVMGDLALVGRPIKGKVISIKPGHTANVEMAKILKKTLTEQRKLRGKPKYNPDKEPVYHTVQILKLLQHRYPFLMIDKVIELTDKTVVAVKNVTFNEPYFQGHFPGNPIMPGVMQVEAMAQAGGILVLASVPDPENWDTFFLKIDAVKFRAQVIPGDTILFKVELVEPVRRGIAHVRAVAYVGNKIVSEADLIAQIVKRKN
jgi:UDP-3-O-[3-hydroxymyristoyl] N-acetylglucosamine deacetylase / 3-hydroxyacyl-[acyl-carrier-protein] dehydratase